MVAAIEAHGGASWWQWNGGGGLSLSLLYFFVFFLFFSSSVFLFFFLSVGWSGRPLCSRPRGASPVLPPCGRQVVSFIGVFLVVSEKKGAGKAGEKSLLLPLFSTRPREEEDLWCRSKRHRFVFFFLFWNVWNDTIFPKTRLFI